MANPITLATGINYPAAVTKAYADQEEKSGAYTAAILAVTEAEAQLTLAKAEDQAALTAAAKAGAGHPGKERTPAAERALAYANEVHSQAQARYGAAADVAHNALAENADAIVPLAIEAARSALATYAAKTAQTHQLITEANVEINNAVQALNMLRPHVRHLGDYLINQVPATATIPAANHLGNLEQVIARLERAMKDRASIKLATV